MCAFPFFPIGLDAVLERLALCFEYDSLGRIVGSRERNAGRRPRFVLGRAAEGVVWRFGCDVSAEVVGEVARLAARERGLHVNGRSAVPPERLESISQRLGNPPELIGEGNAVPRRASRGSRDGTKSRPRHEWVSSGERIVGELWSLD